MLRIVLAGVKTATWPLADELALMDTLFSLHRLRDADRVRVTSRLPDPLPAVLVPPMLLLPLAENAVKYGPAAGHRGTIAIDVRESAGSLAVTIRNPGPYRGRREGGTGLETVQRRLALAYDGRAMLTIAAAGDETVAELTLPSIAPVAGTHT